MITWKDDCGYVNGVPKYLIQSSKVRYEPTVYDLWLVNSDGIYIESLGGGTAGMTKRDMKREANKIEREAAKGEVDDDKKVE